MDACVPKYIKLRKGYMFRDTYKLKTEKEINVTNSL